MTTRKNTKSKQATSRSDILKPLKAYIAVFTDFMRDKQMRSKEKTAHYDIDGVSFDASTGVIIAGCEKSSRGKSVQPAATKGG